MPLRVAAAGMFSNTPAPRDLRALPLEIPSIVAYRRHDLRQLKGCHGGLGRAFRNIYFKSFKKMAAPGEAPQERRLVATQGFEPRTYGL